MTRLKRYLVCTLTVAVIAGAAGDGLLQHARHVADLNRQLVHAVKSGNERLAVQLIHQGATGDAREGQPLTMTQYLRNWWHRLRRQPVTYSPDSKSALEYFYDRHEASWTYDDPQVQVDEELPMLLLQTGANVADESSKGPVFTCAVELRQHRVVRKMLELGADPNCGSFRGATGILYADIADSIRLAQINELRRNTFQDTAATEADAECLADMLQHGLKADSLNNSGVTLLMSNCNASDEPKVTALLKYGASARTIGKSGLSAIHHAAHYSTLRVVQKLVASGADVNTPSTKGAVNSAAGVTPLMLAVDNEHKDAVPWLLDHGANVNARTDRGTTALMIAAGCAHLPVVQLLVKRGANISAQNKLGHSAWDFAKYNEDKSVRQYIGALFRKRVTYDESGHPDHFITGS